MFFVFVFQVVTPQSDNLFQVVLSNLLDFYKKQRVFMYMVTKAVAQVRLLVVECHKGLRCPLA